MTKRDRQHPFIERLAVQRSAAPGVIDARALGRRHERLTAPPRTHALTERLHRRFASTPMAEGFGLVLPSPRTAPWVQASGVDFDGSSASPSAGTFFAPVASVSERPKIESAAAPIATVQCTAAPISSALRVDSDGASRPDGADGAALVVKPPALTDRLAARSHTPGVLRTSAFVARRAPTTGVSAVTRSASRLLSRYVATPADGAVSLAPVHLQRAAHEASQTFGTISSVPSSLTPAVNRESDGAGARGATSNDLVSGPTLQRVTAPQIDRRSAPQSGVDERTSTFVAVHSRGVERVTPTPMSSVSSPAFIMRKRESAEASETTTTADAGDGTLPILMRRAAASGAVMRSHGRDSAATDRGSTVPALVSAPSSTTTAAAAGVNLTLVRPESKQPRVTAVPLQRQVDPAAPTTHVSHKPDVLQTPERVAIGALSTAPDVPSSAELQRVSANLILAQPQSRQPSVAAALQRQTDPAARKTPFVWRKPDVVQGPERVATGEAPIAPGAADVMSRPTAPAAPSGIAMRSAIDIDWVVEQVGRRIARRLEIDSERMGVRSWRQTR